MINTAGDIRETSYSSRSSDFIYFPFILRFVISSFSQILSSFSQIIFTVCMLRNLLSIYLASVFSYTDRLLSGTNCLFLLTNCFLSFTPQTLSSLAFIEQHAFSIITIVFRSLHIIAHVIRTSYSHRKERQIKENLIL